jgi:hypothetical protein
MFLTKGPLPHAALWAAWLGQAAGLLPADCAAAAACGAGAGARGGAAARRAALEALLRSCAQGAASPLCVSPFPVSGGQRAASGALVTRHRGAGCVSSMRYAQRALPSLKCGLPARARAPTGDARPKRASRARRAARPHPGSMWQTARARAWRLARPCATLCKTLISCSAGDGALVARQQLFSVYVHIPPGAELEDETSLFRPHIIADRVATSWGGFSLVQARAARPLIGAALLPAAVPLLHRAVFATEAGACMCKPPACQQAAQPPAAALLSHRAVLVTMGGGSARRRHAARAPKSWSHGL